MEIRVLRMDEIPLAVLTATEIYTATDMLHAESAEEIEQFRRNMSEERLRRKVTDGRIALWGAFENGRLCAVAVMEPGIMNHDMYIRPEYRNSRLESQMLSAMYPITGHDGGNQEKANRTLKVVLVIFVICFIIIAGVVVALSALVTDSRERTRQIVSEINVDDDTIFEESAREIKNFSNIRERDGATGEIDVLPNQLGVSLVTEEEGIYVAENLEYEVIAEEIELFEDTDEQCIKFDINYPQIVYADGRDASAINQMLRDCACGWYDMMYPEPQMDYLLYQEGTERLYMVTEVEYQITYMSNDLICVVFSDYYFPGTSFYEANDMYTQVIDLKTSERYTLDTVIEADDALGQLYYDKLCEIDETYEELPEFTWEIAEQTLHGGAVEGRYYSNLIVTGEGIEIVLTMHYGDGRWIVRGWNAVKFTDEELELYRTNSPFWDKI